MSPRLRIAHVIGNLETGGAQALLIETMRRLSREKFDPFLIHFREPNHFQGNINAQGWECHHIPLVRGFRVMPFWGLVKHLRELKPDVVHTWSDFANITGRAAAVIAEVPHVVVHYQNTYEHRMNEKFARMEQHLALHSDVYIACSRGVEEFLKVRLEVPANLIRTIPNAVPMDVYTQAGETRETHRRERGIPPDVFHIIHTARLEPHKQPEQLLKALSLSTTHREYGLGNFRLTLVGDGSQRRKLEALLDKLDAAALAKGGAAIRQRIVFAGWSRDIPSWLASADVFCLVSQNEGLPLSLIEAMAAGTPVVASNVVGPQEVVKHGKNGLLVDSSDPEDILRSLHRIRRDDILRDRLVIEGKKRAEHYRIEHYIQQLEQLYTELPSRKPKAPMGMWQKLLFVNSYRRIAHKMRRKGGTTA